MAIYYYELCIETDDDFSVEYKNELYTNDVKIVLTDWREIKNVRRLGPWGCEPKSNDKCYEFDEAVQRILENPDQEFDTTGGNRGVVWTRVDAMDYELARVPESFRAGIRNFAYDACHAFGEQETLMSIIELVDMVRQGLAGYLETLKSQQQKR